MTVNSDILILEEAAALCHITPNTTDDEIIHILLKKLYMSDSEEYLFDSPKGFWNDMKIKHIVRLMTIDNDLAHITQNRDVEQVYLKISKHGIDISKQGGWLNSLSFRAAYQSGTYTVFE